MKDLSEKQGVMSEGGTSPEGDFDGEIFLWKVLQPICEQIAAIRGRIENVGKIVCGALEPMKRVKTGASMVSELIFDAILGRFPGVATWQLGGGSGLAGQTVEERADVLKGLDFSRGEGEWGEGANFSIGFSMRSDGGTGGGGRDVGGSCNKDVVMKDVPTSGPGVLQQGYPSGMSPKDVLGKR